MYPVFPAAASLSNNMYVDDAGRLDPQALSVNGIAVGGGAVSSVNGKTGAVSLAATDMTDSHQSIMNHSQNFH